MTIEKQEFNLLKSQYLNFIEQNKDKETISRYLTEMNFINKLEEMASKNNFSEEASFIKGNKDKVLSNLEKFGVRPKN